MNKHIKAVFNMFIIRRIFTLNTMHIRTRLLKYERQNTYLQKCTYKCVYGKSIYQKHIHPGKFLKHDQPCANIENGYAFGGFRLWLI